MRIAITEKEFDKLLELSAADKELSKKLLDEKKKFYNSITTNKRLATEKANELKIKRAKERVINSIEMMLINKDKINVNTVTKHSGLAYNTVKKYKYLIKNRI